MSRQMVELGARSYPIVFTEELPDAGLKELLKDGLVPGAQRVLLVSDTNVEPLYGAGIRRALEEASLKVATHVVPAGEDSKRLSVIDAVVTSALEAGLSRGDLIVALGGGVVGDIAGFAASMLHRGVAFLQVPTSLLAQVDSAVGGKTGVNHPLGKNLLGAFWQPVAVVSSSAVLETLPPRERRCGLAEGLKHGLIADRALVEFCLSQAQALRELDGEAISHVVRRGCEIKAAIVAEDEREQGRRAVLNFGHTLGHAYEQVLGYGALTHGEAVGLGMVFATRLSEHLGACERGTTSQVEGVLGALGLPTEPPSDAPVASREQLMAAARRDKKARGDEVGFVVLREIGRAEIRKLMWQEVEAGGFRADS